eukprot:scaffold1766_cov401-Prasinococcus_capsulatus_cf.AAC.24
MESLKSPSSWLQSLQVVTLLTLRYKPGMPKHSWSSLVVTKLPPSECVSRTSGSSVTVPKGCTCRSLLVLVNCIV